MPFYAYTSHFSLKSNLNPVNFLKTFGVHFLYFKCPSFHFLHFLHFTLTQYIITIQKIVKRKLQGNIVNIYIKSSLLRLCGVTSYVTRLRKFSFSYLKILNINIWFSPKRFFSAPFSFINLCITGSGTCKFSSYLFIIILTDVV